MFYLHNKPQITHSKCLLDIKVLTQQAKGAGALAVYCSGESSELCVKVSRNIYTCVLIILLKK